MGIPTLISTATADDSSEVDITSGIDSTYDEYMFVFTDVNPATDNSEFGFQVNAAGASGFNETVTNTMWRAKHDEADSYTAVEYVAAHDQAQGTALLQLAQGLGSGADESLAGILHLFSPSSTTYVKHFYSTITEYYHGSANHIWRAAGYFNLTAAVDEVTFKMSSGNFDGVIQMYGIA